MAARRSRSTIHLRDSGPFRSDEAEEDFEKLRRTVGITDSKTLAQERINFAITELFVLSPLIFCLNLAYPFHSLLLYHFYANLVIPADFSRISSRVYSVDVEITREDILLFLQTSGSGDSAHVIAESTQFNWSRVNRVLRGTDLHEHQGTVAGLVQDARVIQHVLRHTVMPKGGDRANITPLLSIVTYYVMTNTQFDVADLLIRFIHNISTTRQPDTRKKQNLALGHLISYILQSKYSLVNPSEHDHLPSYFSDHSFHTIFGGKKAKGKRPAEEEEAEEEPIFAEGEASLPTVSGGWQEQFSQEMYDMRIDLHHLQDSHSQFVAQQNYRWQQQQQWQEQRSVWEQQTTQQLEQ